MFLTTEARDEDSEINLTGSLVDLVKEEEDEENLFRLLSALKTLVCLAIRGPSGIQGKLYLTLDLLFS